MFNNLLIPVDSSGCATYRIFFPYWAVRAISQKISFVETTKYVFDASFYQGFTNLMVQRHVHDAHLKIFTEFFKPLSQQLGFWINYTIDDAIGPDDIPKWNHAWKAYQQPTFFDNIKKMLNMSDFVTVTTQELKNYYHNKFEVPNENIIVIGNFLPRWWVGEAYNLSRTLENYDKNLKKPRIGFTSSLTHFDIDNNNNGVDDFTHIVDFIKTTVDKYEWCFIGACPQQLAELVKQKKITVYPCSDILNFMRELHDKNFNAVVAPLQDIEFNRCKSNIKLIECWSLGIPVIAQNIVTYNKYTNLVFDDSNSLQNKLDEVLKSRNNYKDIVKNHRNIVDFGDENFPAGCWLEKNIMPWIQLFSMPQKTLHIDTTKKKEVKNDNIVIEN
jgi:hypothetical protein